MTRVLCVDDDRPILDGLHAFPWNVYHCEWAGEADNGEKALTMLDSLQLDLIVLDIQMPCMDGLYFIPRAQQTLPKAKYIVLSAYRNFDYARIAMRYGVSEYLTKGEFTDEDLGNAIGRLFPQEEKASLFGCSSVFDHANCDGRNRADSACILRYTGICGKYRVFLQASAERI